MSMELEGMDALLKEIEQMGKKIEGNVTKKALTEGAKIYQQQVKNTAPVRTGNLRDNIIISDMKDGTVDIGPDQQGPAFYAHFLEFGTSKMRPQPFMGPVYENYKGQVNAKMADVLKRELGL